MGAFALFIEHITRSTSLRYLIPPCKLSCELTSAAGWARSSARFATRWGVFVMHLSLCVMMTFVTAAFFSADLAGLAAPRAGLTCRRGEWLHHVPGYMRWLTRAHASFVPFVTWSTNPQYPNPLLRRTPRKKCPLWGGSRLCGIQPGLRQTRKRTPSSVCHPRAAHCRCLDLSSAGGSCLAGPPSCEAIHTQGEGHAVCTTPKYWSDQGV